ncbi:MAG: undecaprenyldiphospho-muramoylpentapeptide beta-N-acetylglucosaminyltransferase [Terriglobales bacterium]
MGAIVIAGGGTGGHLMPGLAVARALRARTGDDIVFVGTARGLEARLVPAAGFELRLIRIGGLKSGSLMRRAATMARLPQALVQSARILRQRHAGVVLGLGGYASGPVLAAAALLRVPIVIVEVNAKTGLANRLAAPWVRAAAVNFRETAADFPRAQVELTGIPVRPEFFVRRAPEEPPLVLVFGGSQGAHRLNQIVAAMAPQVQFRILHQTGERDYQAIAAAYAALGERVRAVRFIDDMAAEMGAASVVVCRSGASTLGEIAAAGKAAVLVPLPNSTDQHQLRNAEAYARAGTTVLLEQSQLTAAELAETLRGLLADGARRAALETGVAQFAHPGAAEAIARLVTACRRP